MSAQLRGVRQTDKDKAVRERFKEGKNRDLQKEGMFWPVQVVLTPIYSCHEKCKPK